MFVASYFCCDETEPRKLYTPLTVIKEQKKGLENRGDLEVHNIYITKCKIIGNNMICKLNSRLKTKIIMVCVYENPKSNYSF